MTDRFNVEFVALNRETFIVATDSYHFRPCGRFQFLQRWAWRFLSRVGALAEYERENVTYKSVTIDTQDVIQRVLQQYRALSSFIGKPGQRLLIGAEDFQDLMGHKDVMPYMQFDICAMPERRFMGLKVEVIPWMRGMVVMP